MVTVPPRVAPLRLPPIGFAHRGARAAAAENTIEAFELGLRLGAAGLESDVWLTADGEVVLDHDGVVRSGMRKRPIAAAPRSELPAHVPTLAELYEACGTDFELSLDVKDPAALPGVLAAARVAGAEDRLWLCYSDHRVAAAARDETIDAKLIHSGRRERLPAGLERHAAELRASRLNGLNLHNSEWRSAGDVDLLHRFDLVAFSWDCQLPRILKETLELGVDAVYSDHVERMQDALGHVYPG
jgi:glycerophosphoryl diester phosphodiesterase